TPFTRVGSQVQSLPRPPCVNRGRWSVALDIPFGSRQFAGRFHQGRHVMRIKAIPIIIGLLASPIGAQTTVAPKVGRWTVDYAPSSCDIVRARTANRNGLSIQLRPHTQIHEVTLLVPKTKQRDFRELVTVSPAEVDAEFPPEVQVSTTPDKMDQRIATSLTHKQISSAISMGEITVDGRKTGRVTVMTAGLDKAINASRACIDDLAKRWGAPRTWAVDPTPVRDPRSVFRAEDFPPALLDAFKKGMARVLLRLDAAGKVNGCKAIELAGDVRFADRTCEVLAKRGQFKPATNETGEAVPSFLLVPPVHFILE
ncbi:MAG: hypothetical protein ABI412_04965, partial [Sphingomicrobium sp.]